MSVVQGASAGNRWRVLDLKNQDRGIAFGEVEWENRGDGVTPVAPNSPQVMPLLNPTSVIAGLGKLSMSPRIRFVFGLTCLAIGASLIVISCTVKNEVIHWYGRSGLFFVIVSGVLLRSLFQRTKRHKIVRVWAQPETCLAHEACQVTPVFEMVHYRAVVAEGAQQYFESDRDSTINAVTACPTASLFIEFDDGRIISSADWDKSKGMDQWIDY